MIKCKHEKATQLTGTRLDWPVRWCDDCGALYVRYWTSSGTYSRRAKWRRPRLQILSDAIEAWKGAP